MNCIYVLSLFILIVSSHYQNDTDWWPSYAEDMNAYLDALPMNQTLASGIDLRVSKACGSTYNKVRVSVITQSSTAPSGIKWDFSQKFSWFWTNNYLHSKIITVNEGTPTHLYINNQVVDIEIPRKGKATGGILLADICLSQNSYCIYGGRWSVKDRSTKFLNAVMKETGMHWWYIIGDNFYDQWGSTTKSYFDLLSIDAKRKAQGVVMGNHDYWNNGDPGRGNGGDQLGIGQTQWYATDSAWSLIGDGGKTPFDLSMDPRGRYRDSHPPLNPANNIWWHTMGNIGIIGYSGAFDYSQYQGYFDQACQQFTNDNVAHMLLLGHWDGRNLGCQWNMDAPSLLSKLKGMPSCAALKNKMHYVDGHTHCNHNWDKDNGFMIGGNGFNDYGQCGGDGAQFGHLYVKTTDEGDVQFWYFKFADTRNSNYFDDIYKCINQNGVDGCLNYATLWWSTGGPTPKPKPTPTPSHNCCCYQGQCINDNWCNASKDNCLGACNKYNDKTWGDC